MHHDTPLISTIVAGLVLAYIFGMVANRFRVPPLVGYLFAGIVVGPHVLGFVDGQQLATDLAELGVILLMFGVGLHFSLKDLTRVRALAIPGAAVQIGLATLLGTGLGLFLGWPLGGALLFGLGLSVASTVVLLKALQGRRLIETERGRIAMGWLIVEDLALVLVLVLLPALAVLNGTDTGVYDPFVSFVERLLSVQLNLWAILGLTVIKVAAFAGFMLVVGRRFIPWALQRTAHTGSRELFRLAVLAIGLGVALGSAVLFGVSLALGAFFAGMILSESERSQRAANETLPLREAFAVLFFVAVGMLFDPAILVAQPLAVLATVFIIVIGKSLAAFGTVLLFRRPVQTALTVSASLAQIGEFSFILVSMGVALAILPPEGRDLIVAGMLISVTLNPAVFFVLDLIRPRLEARLGTPPETAEPALADIPAEAAVDRGVPGAAADHAEAVSLRGHSVLVGFGQVGRIVAEGIKADGGALAVIADSDHDVAAARAAGFEAVWGNAASEAVLRLANLPAAQALLVTIANGFEAGSVCASGRRLNPGIAIVARADCDEDEHFLNGLGTNTVIRSEREIARGILAVLRSGATEPEPETPKLPETGNILAQASLVPVSEPELVAEVIETPAEMVVLEAPVVAEEEGLIGPVAPEPKAEAAAPTAVLEPIIDTPSLGEAPAAIDEIVPVPAEEKGEAGVAMTEDVAPTAETEDVTLEIEPEENAVPAVEPEKRS